MCVPLSAGQAFPRLLTTEPLSSMGLGQGVSCPQGRSQHGASGEHHKKSGHDVRGLIQVHGGNWPNIGGLERGKWDAGLCTGRVGLGSMVECLGKIAINLSSERLKRDLRLKVLRETMPVCAVLPQQEWVSLRWEPHCPTTRCRKIPPKPAGAPHWGLGSRALRSLVLLEHFKP